MIIVNQTIGHLCRDIANTMANELKEPTTLIFGNTTDREAQDLDKRICIKKIVRYGNATMLRRITTWVLGAIHMWWKLLWCNRKERLLIFSNPPFSIFLPLFLRNPFSLVIYDIYPDVLVSTGALGSNNFAIRWWKKVNRRVFAKAEKVYTITDGMADCLAQYIEREKITVVPCWPNTSNIHYVERKNNLFVREHHLEDRFVVMYSGNMGLTHRMDVLVELADRMRDYPIDFFIIGGGGKKSLIQQKIRELNTSYVHLLPYQSYAMVPHSLSAADIAVVTLDAESANVSIPSKTYNLMNLGRPIMAITSKDAALARLISKYDIGETFTPKDLKGMEQWILRMMRDKELSERLSRNAKRASSDFTIDNAKVFCK